jgi:hypothetical protein
VKLSNPPRSLVNLVFAVLLLIFTSLVARAAAPAETETNLTAADYKRTLAQLGLTSLRHPLDHSHTNSSYYANFDETKTIFYAKWPDDYYKMLPDPLVLKDGQKVTTAEMWWSLRRPEIVEDFDREIYGRVPTNVPSVNWKVAKISKARIGDVKVITKYVVGRVDNSSCLQIMLIYHLPLPFRLRQRDRCR